MVPRSRRYFSLAAFLLLATPLVGGLTWPDSPDWILKEVRTSAPAPVPPKNLEALLALPGEIDAYLKDHFGLRQKMLRLHKDLTRPVLFKDNEFAVFGKSGRMFVLADDMVFQSAGRVVRDDKVGEAADMLAAMRSALDRRGVRFLVAVPPNSSTIYPDDLPSWARNPGRRTEYDLLLDDLKARGVKDGIASARPRHVTAKTIWDLTALVARALVELVPIRGGVPTSVAEPRNAASLAAYPTISRRPNSRPGPARSSSTIEQHAQSRLVRADTGQALGTDAILG